MIPMGLLQIGCIGLLLFRLRVLALAMKESLFPVHLPELPAGCEAFHVSATGIKVLFQFLRDRVLAVFGAVMA
jgi:hypothetical protein